MSHVSDAPIILTSPDGRFTLGVMPGVGASIAFFRHTDGDKMTDLLRPYDPALPCDPFAMASFPLAPFCNRIIDGKMVFHGREYDFTANRADEPHYLHGDGWMHAWAVKAQTAAAITLTLQTQARDGMPYGYAAELTYTLDETGLHIDLAVTNTWVDAMPFGIGNHPFFPRDATTTLQAHAPIMWQSDRIVPTTPVPTPEKWDFTHGLPVTDAALGPAVNGIAGRDIMDHVFQGWDQRATITWPDRGLKLTFTADAVFENFVIYVPDTKPFFVIEAVTNINDGFNLMARGVADTGTVILEPGQTLSGMTRLQVTSS